MGNGPDFEFPHSDLEIQKLFYKPICTDAEINRIFAVKNTEDYLLKLRADTAVDHMRLFRVLRNRYLKNPDGWTLTGSFDQRPFAEYISMLDPEKQDICSQITGGFVFSNDPNGACLRSPYGDVITVSNSLEYFLFFMNMAYVDFGLELPLDIRKASQRIAIRTMLKTEALDFDMDPRGIVPEELTRQNDVLVSAQLKFIIGHEYGHHIHGHLDTGSLLNQSLFARFEEEPDEYGLERIYNYSERQEFEADESAVQLTKESSDWASLVYGSLTWFAYLDVYEQVSDQLFPVSPWAIRTHPSPLERFKNIFNHAGDKAGISKDFVDGLLAETSKWKEFFLKDVATNTELYEFYGSVYLADPNSEWRGPELVDRVDYY